MSAVLSYDSIVLCVCIFNLHYWNCSLCSFFLRRVFHTWSPSDHDLIWTFPGWIKKIINNINNVVLLIFLLQAQKNERESIRQKLALGSFFDDGPGIYTSCSKSGKPSLSSRWAGLNRVSSFLTSRHVTPAWRQDIKFVLPPKSPKNDKKKSYAGILRLKQ